MRVRGQSSLCAYRHYFSLTFSFFLSLSLSLSLYSLWAATGAAALNSKPKTLTKHREGAAAAVVERTHGSVLEEVADSDHGLFHRQPLAARLDCFGHGDGAACAVLHEAAPVHELAVGQRPREVGPGSRVHVSLEE